MLRKLAHTVKSLTCGRRGTRGESLSEVLVAIAIGALALLMLAMAISVSARVASSSRDNMNDYYAASNDIAMSASGVSLGSGTVSLAKGASKMALVSNSESMRVKYREYAEGELSDIVIFEGGNP